MTPPPTSGSLDRTMARNAAREIMLRVRRVDGGYRLVPVHADQFAVAAFTPAELGRAMLACFTEVELAAYARWKGQRPDLAVLGAADQCSFDEPLNRLGTIASPVLPPKEGHRAAGSWATGGKREQHPADYTPNADGSWTSPKGKRFTAPSMCQAIVRRRLAAGLSIVPVDCVFDLTNLSDQVTKGARRDGQTPHEWLTAAVESYGKPAKNTPRAKPVPGQLEMTFTFDEPQQRKKSGVKAARHLKAVA